jgi:hypothetical protein
MRIKLVLPALLITFAGAFAVAGAAQDKPAVPDQSAPAAQNKPAAQDSPAAAGKPAAAEVPVDPQVKEAARGFIEELLRLTHAPDVYSDLRRSLREVYIPALRDFVEGNNPGVPTPDPKSAAAVAKLLTYMDYLRKAGDELDVALSDNREAMISDVAGQMAKSAKVADIDSVRATLKLPAVTKGLDALYAVTKLLTGFTYDDSRTFSSFSAWASRQDLDMQRALPGLIPGGPQSGGDAVPSRSKVAKAQALVNDFLSISHLDEMVENTHRFVRDVFAETAPIPENERQALREQADQFEFMYNMQKGIMIAMAPSMMAADLTDDQLTQVHSFVRSGSFAKLCDLLQNSVKSGTAFTKGDILEAQKTFEDLENKAKSEQHSEAEENKLKAEWDALAEKWTETLKKRMSPETLDGLKKAMDELKDQGAPI